MIAPIHRHWAVEIDGLAKNYLCGWPLRWIHGLESLTLRLAPGQVLGLFGPNGSGKSTTLKIMAGLLFASEGECRIFGHRAGSDEARALIGYLPESPRFSPHLTGSEFLQYCAGLSSLDRSTQEKRVHEVLGWTGLDQMAGQRLTVYSKGMLQRLGLAQAVLHDPPLVLLDEPAGGLDPNGRMILDCLIHDLAARGKAVVFSSHLLAQAETLCDRLAILDRGRLLVEGTPAELFGIEPAPAPQPSRLEKLYLEKLREHE